MTATEPKLIEKMVQSKLSVAGTENAVTAVLLNFRGYDTVLEMAVLLMSLLGVWMLDLVHHAPQKKPTLVLETFIRIILGPLVLIALYLLWVGGHGPGGAFQAGSVIGAAGVMLILVNWQMPLGLQHWPLRTTCCLGLSTFLAAAIWPMFNGHPFLQYNVTFAKPLILVIECAAALSIGLILTLLFVSISPKESPLS